MAKRQLQTVQFALVVAAAATLTGCMHDRLQTDADIWHSSGPVSAPGTLHIRNSDGPINVRPSADAQFHVTADAKWHRGNPGKDLHFQQVSDGADVTVCASRSSGACSWQHFRTKSSGLQA